MTSEQFADLVAKLGDAINEVHDERVAELPIKLRKLCEQAKALAGLPQADRVEAASKVKGQVKEILEEFGDILSDFQLD